MVAFGTTDLQQSFEAYARFFVYMNFVTPGTCVDTILMNVTFK